MQTRKPKSVFVNVNGSSLEHEILNVCEFNSTRKRMSTVDRCPDGKPKLFWKGADTVMQEAVRRCQTLHGESLRTHDVRLHSAMVHPVLGCSHDSLYASM